MRALVTGATGFIGSHLAETLVKEGFEVTCLVRSTTNLRFIEGLSVELMQGDCADPASLGGVRDFDYIFHLAGLTKFSSEETARVGNVTATANIVDIAVRQNPNLKRFVHMSSLAAAGPSPDGKPLAEDCAPAPVSIYGRTKLEGERIALGCRDRMPVTVIRPPAVYGPRDRDFLVVYKMVQLGLLPSWGRSLYSFLYVEDLVSGIILSALEDAGTGEVFFLSDGTVYSDDALADAMAAAVGCGSPLRLRLPRGVLPLLAGAGEKLKGLSIVNSDKIREILHPYWVCDATKAKQRLGFVPKVPLKEGAKWTADWYRLHNWL